MFIDNGPTFNVYKVNNGYLCQANIPSLHGLGYHEKRIFKTLKEVMEWQQTFFGKDF